MMGIEFILIVIPALFAGYSFFFRYFRTDRIVLVVCAVIHLTLTMLLSQKTVPTEGVMFGIDSLSFVFLLILSVLFLATAVYSIDFIRQMHESGHYNVLYVPALLLFLAAMTGVIVSRNLGLIWVFIEATTLASATLIYHYKTKESLEAVWKYLFICSIGIALAFIAVILMLEASRSIKGIGLNVDMLIKNANSLSPLWLTIAFVFALIGYGTKMGLAPMHTWLPDAHSQAPSPASALFSGALLNCAFLAILRYYQIIVNTDMGQFARTLFLVLGLFSIFLSSVYVYRIVNYKRKLAYSSIEHVGILATGIGLGGFAIYAAMLHAICHSLAKHLMFLNAGNIFHAYKTINIKNIHGAYRSLPSTAWLIMIGTIALLGFPPFGTFISKFLILEQMIVNGRWVTMVVFILLVTVISYGLLKAAIQMAFLSEKDAEGHTVEKEHMTTLLPQWFFLGLLLCLGLYIPQWLNNLLYNAAALLLGKGGV
ncbi:MAG: hypothetical protein L3V56_03140 [Candidatus Magnetoovum sp. WYHC-5]|nr:hypothetical protein [Candidatus Magnetoovum sp. WYHC-5]